MTLKVLLIIHVTAGSIALAAGTLAALAPKGRKLHNRSGLVFAAAMAASTLAGLALSLIKDNGFLFAISMFTLYLVGTGYLFGTLRQMENLRKALRPAGVLGLLFAVYMLWVGWRAGGQALMVLGIFGTMLAGFSIADLALPLKPTSRIPRHAGRMGGAFIAAVTAVLVVNVSIDPAWVLWLGPTFVGTLLLTVGISRWRRKVSRIV